MSQFHHFRDQRSQPIPALVTANYDVTEGCLTCSTFWLLVSNFALSSSMYDRALETFAEASYRTVCVWPHSEPRVSLVDFTNSLYSCRITPRSRQRGSAPHRTAFLDLLRSALSPRCQRKRPWTLRSYAREHGGSGRLEVFV